MSLFGFFKQMKNAASAGGNFSFIAQNIATIYYVISETDKCRGWDQDKKLYATGIFDIISYLSTGAMTEDQVAQSILYGKVGKVSLGFYSVEHSSLFNREKNWDLIGFAMQLEVFIFDASDTGVNYRDIVDQVAAHKSTISKTINDTLANGRKSPIYKAVKGNVSNWLSDPNILEIIDNYQPY